MAILYSKSKVFSRDELWRLLLQRDGLPCETHDSFEQLLGFLNKLLDTDIQELSKQPIHLEPEPMSRSSDSSFCPSKMNTSVSFRFVLERTYPPDSDAVWCSLKVKQYIKTQEDNVGFLFGSCGKRFWLKFNDNLGEIMGSPFVVEIIYQIARMLTTPYPQLFTNMGHLNRRTFASASRLALPRTRMVSAGGWHDTKQV